MKTLLLPGFSNNERSKSLGFSDPEMMPLAITERLRVLNATLPLLESAERQASDALNIIGIPETVFPATQEVNSQQLATAETTAQRSVTAPIANYMKADVNLHEAPVETIVEELTPDSARRGVAAALEEGELKNEA